MADNIILHFTGIIIIIIITTTMAAAARDGN